MLSVVKHKPPQPAAARPESRPSDIFSCPISLFHCSHLASILFVASFFTHLHAIVLPHITNIYAVPLWLSDVCLRIRFPSPLRSVNLVETNEAEWVSGHTWDQSSQLISQPAVSSRLTEQLRTCCRLCLREAVVSFFSSVMLPIEHKGSVAPTWTWVIAEDWHCLKIKAGWVNSNIKFTVVNVCFFSRYYILVLRNMVL